MATNAGGRPLRTGWFTSSRSNNGNQCVEVRFDVDTVWIRDSKYRRAASGDPGVQPVLSVSAAEWDLVVTRLRAGLPVPELVADSASGEVELRRDGTVLTFTRAEWDAFLAGVRDGEFDRVPLPG